MSINTRRVLWFLALLISVSRAAAASGYGLNTYIVQMSTLERQLNVFATAESWYHSIVSDVKGKLSNTDYVSSRSSVAESFLHTYNRVFHGFTTRLTVAQAQALKSMPGVLGIYPDRVNFPQTTHTPEFLGLNLSSGLWPESNYGEDVVIGVLDTGIWPERLSFSDENLGPIPSRWKGSCVQEPSFNASHCNRKLIGAKYYLKGYEADKGPVNTSLEFKSPRDGEGHGTHTASTAAGSLVSRANLFGLAEGTAQGIAPRARVAIYKVCWIDGCFDSDILAAFDAAIADGVDIISLSVGSDTAVPYYDDPIAVGAYAAVKNGVFVSCAAGNSGPGPFTVANSAPWITTVAASTVDRSFPVDVKLGNGVTVVGTSFPSGPGSGDRLLPLIYAGNATKAGVTPSISGFCLDGTLDPQKMQGKIVLCDRGNNSRTEKGWVVKEAGGAGMILANLAVDGESVLADAHLLPATAVGAKAGALIKEYMLSATDPTALISSGKTVLGVKPAPLMASFSSRGPNPQSLQILKPDITGPGVNILAAWTGNLGPSHLVVDSRRVEFNIISGTSMSCPHISGIAALLKGAHPTWSAAMIKSAIMTSAYVYDNSGTVMLDETTGDTATPYAFGAGHVDAQKALDPGLVYDVETADYLAFLCSLGQNYTESTIRLIDPDVTSCPKGSPYNLNYPSFSAVFDQMESKSTSFSASFNRTVTNVGSGNATYKVNFVAPKGVKMAVTPSMLEFAEKGEKLSFRVDVETEPVSLADGDVKYEFGSLAWTDGRHVVHSPIVINWSANITFYNPT